MSVLPREFCSQKLLIQPSIPDAGEETTDNHQHGKIPECIVTETSTCAKDHEDTGQFIANSFFGQLYSRKCNDTHCRGIEARK